MTMSTVPEPSRRPAVPVLSGRKVVAIMFLFGIAATAALYIYWTLHLMPFMPLQQAIVAEFPGSAPRVDGGQRKKRDNTPVILRIVMKTELDVFSTASDLVAEREALQARVIELSQQHTTLPGLHFVELHLYRLVKEKEIVERSFRFDLRQRIWEEIDGKGAVLTGVGRAAGATTSLPIGATP